MNLTIFRLIGAVTFFSFVILTNEIFHLQANAEENITGNLNYKFDELIELRINKKIQVESCLSIVLASFSHKRPCPGGPSKATAYLIISNGEVTEEIMLSVHGVQGKSEVEDELSDSNRYDSVIWKNYIIQLKSFNYNKSVKLIVSVIK